MIPLKLALAHEAPEDNETGGLVAKHLDYHWQTAPDWLELIAQWHFSSALSLLELLLTLLAVVAGSISAWRFGADAGWTNAFFISNGVWSHWQVWCAFAAGSQAFAYTLHRTTDRKLGIPALIPVKSSSERRSVHND